MTELSRSGRRVCDTGSFSRQIPGRAPLHSSPTVILSAVAHSLANGQRVEGPRARLHHHRRIKAFSPCILGRPVVAWPRPARLPLLPLVLESKIPWTFPPSQRR